MKKVILVAMAVFAFGSASAQDVKFGAKLGLNSATQSTTIPVIAGENSSLESVTGVNIGGYANIKISDKFSVQPELLYSMQGAKLVISNASGPEKIETTLSMDYINLPIMAKFMVAKKISLQAGPQIGFLVSATGKNSSNFFGGPNSTIDFKDKANGVDFGLNFGAGYDITEKLSVDLRYNIGLSQLEKNLETGQSASKNRVFSLNLGYSF